MYFIGFSLRIGRPVAASGEWSFEEAAIRHAGEIIFAVVPEGAAEGTAAPAPVSPGPGPVRKIRRPRRFGQAGGTSRPGPRGPGGTRPGRPPPGCHRSNRARLR